MFCQQDAWRHKEYFLKDQFASSTVFQCFEQSFKYLRAKTHRKYLEYLLKAAQVKVSMEAQAAQRGPKRNRGLLSCLECHRRKQKCDRLLPCRDCVQRGVPQKCNYKIPV